MKEFIEVRSNGGQPSKIVVGQALDLLPEYLAGRRTIVITDSNIHRLHRGLIDSCEHIIIGLGETNKNLRMVEKVYSSLLEMNADRQCFLLGFGGGIVSDVVGFAASTYMRGVPFGFVATTLLAQVDASVGGKNGVNVDGFKNIAGTFNQPEFVLCDSAMLRTLPERELRAGMAEIVKAAVIADPELFGLLERHPFADFLNDPQLLARAVVAAIRVKAAIVERDEKERGERRKLNLGHTIAHAIEKCEPSVLHGEAVAMGLASVSRMAVAMGRLDEASAVRIESLLGSMGLVTVPPVDAKRLSKAMRSDKKRDGDMIHQPVPTSIGSCEVLKISFGEFDSLLGL